MKSFFAALFSILSATAHAANLPSGFIGEWVSGCSENETGSFRNVFSFKAGNAISGTSYSYSDDECKDDETSQPIPGTYIVSSASDTAISLTINEQREVTDDAGVKHIALIIESLSFTLKDATHLENKINDIKITVDHEYDGSPDAAEIAAYPIETFTKK